jgi:signal transduction histidine kinase
VSREQLPKVRLRFRRDLLPLDALRSLVRVLAPQRAFILDHWAADYQETFGDHGFFRGAALAAWLESEFTAVVAGLERDSVADFRARLAEMGRAYAERGVPYGELVVSMNLFEEACMAAMRREGTGLEESIRHAQLIDKLSHFRIIELAEAYFYRYMQLLQEKGRELALERERHDRELMRAEKLAGLGQLAAGIAHEINNPLGTIAITTGNLRDALSAEATDLAGARPELVRGLARIEFEVGRCKKITTQLLDLARVRPASIEEFRPDELVRRLVEVASYQARGEKKTVEADLAPDTGAVHSDPGRVEQVVLNLLANALDAVPPGGHVRVRTRRQDDSVVIEVDDDGCGIPPEHIERIFEPFFTTKPPGKGTGLGLAVGYTIMRELRGHLQVSSQPGRGTTARIVLPASAGE